MNNYLHNVLSVLKAFKAQASDRILLVRSTEHVSGNDLLKDIELNTDTNEVIVHSVNSGSFRVPLRKDLQIDHRIKFDKSHLSLMNKDRLGVDITYWYKNIDEGATKVFISSLENTALTPLPFESYEINQDKGIIHLDISDCEYKKYRTNMRGQHRLFFTTTSNRMRWFCVDEVLD